MSYEVVIQQRPASDELDFFVMRRSLDGRELLKPETADLFAKWERVPSGSTPDPSFRIDREVWEAMVAQGIGLIQPTAASERHLTDTIAIRDRLLAMVEKTHDLG